LTILNDAETSAEIATQLPELRRGEK
jgi:hypothetical protein